MFFEKPEIKAARELFTSALAPYVPTEPLDGVVAYSIDWVFPWLKKHRKETSPLIPISIAPDMDNLNKLFFDVLGDMKFFVRGDQQLSGGMPGKYYGECPGIALRLTECNGLSDFVSSRIDFAHDQLWFMSQWEDEL